MVHGVHLVVFAKAPQPGSAKTRLIPALGRIGAATLARKLLGHALSQAAAAGMDAVELCMSPAPQDSAWRDVEIASSITLTAQGEGDLGERMARALERAILQHQCPVMLMGTDCPGLTSGRLSEAARQLTRHDAVLLPARDGGYVLIGLNAPCPELFSHMPWSTAVVAGETLRRMATLGLRVWQGPTLQDIDEAADLAQLPGGFLPANY